LIDSNLENEKKGNGYSMIPVLPETYKALADLMPKSWTWDRCIRELTEIWAKQQGKVIRTGKPSQDNQAS
jgi:hypothetical protein